MSKRWGFSKMLTMKRQTGGDLQSVEEVGIY